MSEEGISEATDVREQQKQRKNLTRLEKKKKKDGAQAAAVSIHSVLRAAFHRAAFSTNVLSDRLKGEAWPCRTSGRKFVGPHAPKLDCAVTSSRRIRTPV